MYDNIEFLECIQTIENSGIGESPPAFPQGGKVYTLASWREVPDIDNEVFVVLEEFGKDYEWHSEFFRPIDRDIISECLDMSIDDNDKDVLRKVKEDA